MSFTNFEVSSRGSVANYSDISPQSRGFSISILSVAFRALQAIKQFFCDMAFSISNFFFPNSSKVYIEDYDYEELEPSAPPDYLALQEYRHPNGEVEMLPVARQVNDSRTVFINNAMPYNG